MKSAEQRIDDEQRFHNEIFESGKREEVGKYYSINHAILADFDKKIFSSPSGGKVLEYGCGMGDKLFTLAKKGYDCHGIDISDFAISELSKKASDDDLSIDYRVMNAEDLSYGNDFFDTIYGSGILHHLDLEKSYSTISEKLSPNGKAIFNEPLGHNPIINGFRNKTPELRTEDEHPLMMKDLELAKKYFGKVEIKYYYLSTLALPLIFKKSPKSLVSMTDALDRFLFLFPFLKKQAWLILLELSDPKL